MDFGQYSWPKRRDPTELLTCYLRETVQPYIYIYIYIHTHTYIYKRTSFIVLFKAWKLSPFTYIYIYIYIYICICEWGKLSSFKKDNKTWESLSTLLDFIIKKNPSLFLYLHLSLYLSLLPLLACIYLNNAWDLVLWALPLSVCLFKINRFMYSPIVSRFG